MTLRQPITRVRRHQKHLLTITHQKIVGHAPKCLKQPGQTPVCATPTVQLRRLAGYVGGACFPHKRGLRGIAGLALLSHLLARRILVRGGRLYARLLLHELAHLGSLAVITGGLYRLCSSIEFLQVCGLHRVGSILVPLAEPLSQRCYLLVLRGCLLRVIYTKVRLLFSVSAELVLSVPTQVSGKAGDARNAASTNGASSCRCSSSSFSSNPLRTSSANSPASRQGPYAPRATQSSATDTWSREAVSTLVSCRPLTTSSGAAARRCG